MIEGSGQPAAWKLADDMAAESTVGRRRLADGVTWEVPPPPGAVRTWGASSAQA